MLFAQQALNSVGIIEISLGTYIINQHGGGYEMGRGPHFKNYKKGVVPYLLQ